MNLRKIFLRYFFENIEEYNPNKKRKTLIIFDDMIADMHNNNVLNNDMFNGYSNDMVDIYKNIEESNPNNKRKIFIILDDMIVGILNNKRLIPIVTEFFITGRKLIISLVFITQSYSAVSKILD